MKQNHIWLELDKPAKDLKDAERKAFYELQCELANNLIRRLASADEPTIGTEQGQHFWFHENREEYCFTTGSHGEYLTLPHKAPGVWLNLDYYGRA